MSAGPVTRDRVRARFIEAGVNSSHFVLLIGDFEFFESSAGWIFAYRLSGGVGVLSQEPLAPAAALGPRGQVDYAGLADAWREWAQAVSARGARIAAFLAVQPVILPSLRAEGFQAIRMGREPWMDLRGDVAPRGNHAKGVRAARNQAIRAGVSAVEIRGDELAQVAVELRAIEREWDALTAFRIDAFLMASDALAYPELRRYFVARRAAPDGAARIEAFLIASPIPAIDSWFIEELIYRADSPRGVSELLMLEALSALKASGSARASLGIVSLNSIALDEASDFSPGARVLVRAARALLKPFYNTEGLELFRKRFNPAEWTDVWLAARAWPDSRPLSALGWLRVILAVVRVHRPRLVIRPARLARDLAAGLRACAWTWALLALSAATFVFVNRGGALPASIERDYGFVAAAPLGQWLYRSVASDFLCYGPAHFAAMSLLLVALLPPLERAIPRARLSAILVSVILFDDFLKYLLVLHPFQWARPELYATMARSPDVGLSLVVATIAGLRVNQLRRFREPVFILGIVAMVFGFLHALPHLHAFALSLDHFLFFAIGYATGKARFELQRRRDRAAAKPPATDARRLRLVRPSPRYRASMLEAVREWRAEGLAWHRERDLPAIERDFDAFVRAESSRARRAPEGEVRSTELWGIVDDVVVGVISIRHELTGALRAVGGHIGYDVRPGFRRRGLATAMLRQALHEARSLGLARAMLTCDDGNVGSIRSIEACGGRLERKLELAPDRPLKRRYWIELSSS